MSDYSTVRAETAFNVTAYLHAEDDDRIGNNLTRLFMPGFAIFALYLLVGSAALYPLFSPDVRNLLEKNIYAKHILGYLCLLFLIVLSGAKDVHYFHTIVFTGFLYLWFLLTTKLSLPFWIATISIFGLLYALQLYKQTKDVSHKQKKVITEIEYGVTALGFVVSLVGYFTGTVWKHK